MDFMGTNAIHMQDINASLDLSDNLKEGEWMGLYIESEDLTIPTTETPAMSMSIGYAGRKQRINLALEAYVDIVNSLMGAPTWDITTGTPDILKFAIVIPFCFENAPNAIHINGPEDGFGFTYRHNNANGGKIAIYGIPGEDIPENYLVNIGMSPRTGEGRVPITIPEKNVLYVFVAPRDPGDLINVYKDGKVINDAYGIQGTKLSQIVKKIETGTLEKAVFNLCPAKVTESLLSDNVSVVVDHGSNTGTSKAYYIALEYNRRRMEKSQIKVATFLDSKTKNMVRDHPELQGIVYPGISAGIGQGVVRPPRRLALSNR